jgi:spermidine synthase
MRTRSTAVLLLFGLSGIAGLGYQVAWTRMFSVGLGHEMPGLLAVVTAFFVGLALGAAALDRVIARSPVPGRWYAGLEFVIAVWAIVVVIAAPWLNGLAATLIGAEPTPLRQWLVAFGLPMVALLPATAAMGGTLPAVERLAGRLAGRGTTLAGLYAANTFGAMLGIVLTATLVIPLAGLTTTVLLLAAVNVACGLAMWLGPAADERSHPPVEHTFGDAPRGIRLTILLLATGTLGIGYEVAGVRVIGQVLENTVYTYATTVAVYLLGTAIGAAAWQRFGPTDRFAGPAGYLLGGLALTAALGAAAMAGTEAVYEGVRRSLFPALGGGGASIAAEVAVALIVFGPITLVMGATFSHLVLAARRPGGGIGVAMAINTLGGALAPALVGVILIPGVGARWTLTIIVAGYLVLLPLLGVGLRRTAPRAASATAATPSAPASPGLRRPHLILPMLAITVLAFPLDLQLVRPPTGMRFLPDAVREGVMATVAVAEDDRGGRVLKVNNQFNMGGTRFSFGDRRQGHIPMLLHPAPRSALFLGVGSGLTAGTATLHGDVAVTAVELVPEIVGFLPKFEPANRLPDIDRVVTADARRFVRADTGRYDVIVADLFHPARDGAGGLYTREHFAAVRERLADGGVFCQWLPLYQLDAPVVATIVRTFLDVFPNAGGWIGTYNPETPMLGLIGRIGDPPAGAPWSLAGLDPDAGPAEEAAWLPGLVARRSERLGPELTQLALTRPIDLLACRLAGPAELRALAGDGPLNRDDRPRVVYSAPWYTYATTESGVRRIEELLALPGRRQIVADDALAALPAEQTGRLGEFIAARDAFLRSRIALGRGDLEGSWTELLAAMAASPEFRTAAVVAVSEAEQLGRTGLTTSTGRVLPVDRPAAIAFLDRVIAARPDLLDARRARSALGRLR